MAEIKTSVPDEEDLCCRARPGLRAETRRSMLLCVSRRTHIKWYNVQVLEEWVAARTSNSGFSPAPAPAGLFRGASGRRTEYYRVKPLDCLRSWGELATLAYVTQLSTP